MNKLTKAAIAGGVGIALLLGGAGTLATWNTSTNISGGTIVAGSLTIGTPVFTSPATSFWSVKHTTAGAVVTKDLTLTGNAFTVTSGGAAFTSSPGDQLIYTSTVPLTVTGTNLVAVLSLTSGAIAAVTVSPTSPATTLTPAQTAQQNANNALASALANSVVFTAPSLTAVVPAQPYTYNLATGVQNVGFTATMTFPNNQPTGTPLVYSDNATQGGQVSMAAMALTLTQTN